MIMDRKKEKDVLLEIEQRCFSAKFPFYVYRIPDHVNVPIHWHSEMEILYTEAYGKVYINNISGAEHTWYVELHTQRLRSVLPLPQSDKVRFLFGCEIEMNMNNVLGLAPEHYDNFDFVVIPTNHLHQSGVTCRGDEDVAERAGLWCSRLDHVLEQNLPFHKIGIAHLTDTGIMGGKGYLEALQLISDEEYIRLFRKAANRGVGIELNFNWLNTPDDEMEIHLRPYRIAKEEGCKFYLGSDAHAMFQFEHMKENFQKITDLLQLDDSHKFTI